MRAEVAREALRLGVTSLPSRKPQLWEDPVYCLRQIAVYSVRKIRRDGWWDRPHLVRLREHGLVMEINPGDYIGRHLFVYGIWEIAGTRLVETLLAPGMRFVDVGANIGYYSVLAGKLVGDPGSVVSFEPHPVVRARLTRNLALNRLDNVSVRAEAVARNGGEVQLFLPRADVHNDGLSSIVRGAPRTTQVTETVPATTLDDLGAEFSGQETGPD